MSEQRIMGCGLPDDRADIYEILAEKAATIAQQAETIRTLRAALVDKDAYGVSGWDICRVCGGNLANPDPSNGGYLGHDPDDCPAAAALAASEGQA